MHRSETSRSKFEMPSDDSLAPMPLIAPVSTPIADRLAHVERRLWLTSAALVVAILAGVAAVTVAAGGEDEKARYKPAALPPNPVVHIERLVGSGNAPPALRASGLIIVDQNGEERMALEINDKGEAVFTINDAQGKNTFQAP